MPKQPDWLYDDEEKLKRYKARLQWAKTDQQQFRNQAEIYLTYYRNKNKVFTRGGQRVIVPRAIKNVDAMFAALTAFDIWPLVYPKGLTTIDMADVQQQLLRSEWEEQEVLEQAEYAIKEALICGIGFVKVGYEYEEDEPEDDEELAEELAEPDADPDEVMAPRVIKDNVLVEHIPYDEVYFDPEAKKWEDIRWIVQKYELPIEDVKNDDTIPEDRKKDLKHDTHVKQEWREAAALDRTKEPNPDEARISLYDMYNLEYGTVCTFAEGHDKILKEVPLIFAQRPKLHQRNPFVPYVSRTDVHSPIGISDVQVMKPSIDEENVLRSSIATYVERMKPKILSEEGVFTDQAKKAIRSQEWAEVVELRQGAILGNSVKPMEFPSLPQESFVQDAKAASDSDSSIGLNDLLQGQLPAGRKTATAMAQLAESSTVRQSEKRNHLSRFYGAIAERMLFVMKLLYEQDRVVRMVEDYGDIVWNFSAEDIAFESAVGIELEQKEVLDSDAKREKYMMLLNVLGADPTVDQAELKKLVLKQLGIPAEVIRNLIKTPEAMQAEQAAQLQAQAQGQIAEEGVIPDPANIPGPLPGSALAQMANEGELPNA